MQIVGLGPRAPTVCTGFGLPRRSPSATAGGRFAPGARTLAAVKTRPKATIVHVTDEEVRAQVRAWQDAHPGFNRTNYVDCFRDESGELIETDEFLRAARM